MTALLANQNVFTKVIQANTMFVNTLILRDFEHMEEVLGNYCWAIALPEDILLWYSTTNTLNEFSHTVTVQHEDEMIYLYGNVIITSNDEDNIYGIQDLSEHQIKWLRDNSCLSESNLHKNYVLHFKTY